MAISAIILLFIVAVTLLAFVVARRLLTTGAALAVTGAVLGAQIVGVLIVAESTLANMG